MLYPTNIFTSSLSFTPCDCHQRSKIFFWNYFNLISAEKSQSRKYIQILADPFSVSSKPFIWVGLLFGNYLILLKAPPPSTTSLKESSVKISFRNSFPHHTLKLCAWTSLEGAFVEKENFRPITSWHVTLPSPQDAANYKVPRIATRFCYHYSETNRNLPSVMQKTNHTLARVSDDISSPAPVNDDTSSPARVRDDISRPIRLWQVSPIKLRHMSLTHPQTPINRSLPKVFGGQGFKSAKTLQESSLKAFKNFNLEIEEHSKQNHPNYLPRS